jgi:hypothetical protein
MGAGGFLPYASSSPDIGATGNRFGAIYASSLTATSVVLSGSSTLGGASTDIQTLRGQVTMQDATSEANAVVVGGDAKLWEAETGVLRTNGQVRATNFQTRQFATFSSLNFVRINGTELSPADVADTNEVGRSRYFAWFNAALRECSSIDTLVDGTPSGSIVPGRVNIQTRNSAGTLANRMSIRSTGRMQQNDATLDGWMVARGADTSTDIPTLGIDHRHATRAIINFAATAGATSDNPIWTDTSAGSLAQKIKVTINGNTRWIYAYSN